MQSKALPKIVLTAVALLLLTAFALAVIESETVRYGRSITAIRGRVTSRGSPIRMVWVDVYDNAQVRLNNSLPFAEQRRRQTKIASAEPNEKGDFRIKHLPKGFYEIEFGNRGMGGYNVLSVLVTIDPNGSKESICAD